MTVSCHCYSSVTNTCPGMWTPILLGSNEVTNDARLMTLCDVIISNTPNIVCWFMDVILINYISVSRHRTLPLLIINFNYSISNYPHHNFGLGTMILTAEMDVILNERISFQLPLSNHVLSSSQSLCPPLQIFLCIKVVFLMPSKLPKVHLSWRKLASIKITHQTIWPTSYLNNISKVFECRIIIRIQNQNILTNLYSPLIDDSIPQKLPYY